MQHLIAFLLAVNLKKDTFSEPSAAYSTNCEQDETLRKVLQLKQDIAALEVKRDKAKQFNEKVALNVKVQKLKQRLTAFQ